MTTTNPKYHLKEPRTGFTKSFHRIIGEDIVWVDSYTPSSFSPYHSLQMTVEEGRAEWNRLVSEGCIFLPDSHKVIYKETQ